MASKLRVGLPRIPLKLTYVLSLITNNILINRLKAVASTTVKSYLGMHWSWSEIESVPLMLILRMVLVRTGVALLTGSHPSLSMV